MRSNDYSRDASLRRRRAQRSSSRRRGAAGLLALALAGALAVGGTVAYLSASTDTVTNTFDPGEVTTDIVEGFDGEAKSDVKIANTGDIPVYVRAKVVVNWTDADGNVAASVPAGYSYEVTPASWPAASSGWTRGADGFLYYTTALAERDEPGSETANLLDRVTVSYPQGVDAESAEYFLSVEILSESIQSLPDDAVEQAWSSSVADVKVGTDGKLTVTKKTTA